MPLFKYFGWAGSFLLVALLAANWCFPAPIAPPSDVTLDHKVHIRIHEWPERVVLDTTHATPAQDAKADGETEAGESGAPVLAERHPSNAFAETAPIAGPCFPPSCSTHGADLAPSPIEKGAPFQNRERLSMTARKRLTLPNPLHKPPGRI